MIEKMKVVSVVSAASRRDELLSDLRSLGLLHLSERKDADAGHIERISALTSAISALQEFAGRAKAEALDDAAFETLFTGVSDAIAEKKSLTAARISASAAAELLQKWGSFDPADFHALRAEGIDFHVYRMDKKTLAALSRDPTLRYIRLSPVEKRETVAVLGTLSADYMAEEFSIPEKGVEELRRDAADYERRRNECDALLREAAVHLPDFRERLLRAQNDAAYSGANNTVEASDGLVWLTGYVPEGDVETFKTAAAQHAWAWAIDDPADEDEKVPTKVKYNRLTRLMVPLFDILGITPGYREYDISFWFLGFFTLFFAMIIGDAGYGCLMLLGAAVWSIQSKKMDDTVILLWVLSIATVIWGSITGTWFGMEEAMNVPFLRSLVVPGFSSYPGYFGVSTTAQQNAIMKFSISIGAIQISLACLMNVRTKIRNRDLSAVADLAWLAATCAFYFLIMYLVIGENVALEPIAVTVGLCFVLVVLFGAMSPEKSFSRGLKDGLSSAFTVFFDTISAFGNVMSYIRLFAVGMASLAIAQSFNSMAANFSGVLMVIGVLILLFGHALNFVMGILSVFVHGVRLNLLEFSGQLGMEWTGIAYEPFKKSDIIKK